MEIQTPYFEINLDRLYANLDGPVRELREKANCKILLALKGFSCPEVISLMSYGIDGVSASGLYESILGREKVNKYVVTVSPAFKDGEIETIAQNSNAVVFNSFSQFQKYGQLVSKENASCGLRLNPECSTLPESFKANPCKAFSRLGVPFSQMPPIDQFGPGKIEGILIHTMCEQDAEALYTNVKHLINRYDAFLRRICWLNLGGGQLIAKAGYHLEEAVEVLNLLHETYNIDILLEPCEGLVCDCGYFHTTVIDIVSNEKTIAVIDGSAICHIPDTAYIGWKREICNASCGNDYPYSYRIEGCSCYPSDTWGDYSFPEPLSVGDRIVFKDAAAYTIVKGNFFNGLVMPSVVVNSQKDGIQLVRSYDYNSFSNLQ